VHNSFWRSKRVLVTGNTGFKGSWLTLWLTQLGALVSGLSLDIPTAPSSWTSMSLNDDIVTKRADIRDLGAVRSALDEVQPDVLFHLAAQPFVRRSYAQPIETFATNVMGTAHVLEAARDIESLRVIVNVTSDKCYDNIPARMPLVEDSPMGGADPYSASKGCAELVAAAYDRSFLTNTDRRPITLVSVRAGNVVGGGDWGEDRLLPDLMRAARSGVPVPLRNPAAVRPWQHVLNPLHGYLTLAKQAYDNPTLHGGWNFGPDRLQMANVGELAEAVQAQWGEGTLFLLPDGDGADGTEALHEAAILAIDSSKALRTLGWMPHWDLKMTVAESVAWYRLDQDGEDMREISLRQIESYTASVAKETSEL